jgi:hypothetical protein
MSKRPDWPRCSRPKKDGTPCNSAARSVLGEPAEDGLCAPHAPRVEHPAQPTQDAPPELESALSDVPSVAVESLRDALRDAVSTEEVAELMQRVLLDALSASKETFMTCPHCHKRSPQSLPDLGVRAQAIRGLLESFEGRLKEQTDADERKLDRRADLLLKERSAMTDAELARTIVQLREQLAADDQASPPSGARA